MRSSCVNLERKIVGPVRRLSCLTILFLAASCFAQTPRQTSPALKKPLIYQVGQFVHINAGGPRPLLQAVEALQQKYGWVVDYEDPQYPAASAGAPNPPSPPNRRRANIGGASENGFSVQFNVGPTPDSRPDEEPVLTTVVDAYNQSGAAEFKLLKMSGGGFAVVGTGVRDKNGEVTSQQPVLDSLITVVSERRTAGKTIALICQKVSQESSAPISVEPAENLHDEAGVAVGGSRVEARTLLSRTLLSMGEKLYWRLIYDTDGKNYVLSIHGLSP
jgi:hypothetical protein